MKNIFISICVVLFAIISFVSNAETQTANTPAKRVIALAPHIVEMLFEAGAGDVIIGTTAHADYPEAANDIPRIGNYSRLNIEEILALDPDLIIAWRTGNPSDDLSRLKSLGLNIVYSNPKALEDVAAEIKYFAHLTGFDEAGAKVSKSFLKRLSTIRAQYINKESISVFYELWPQPLTTTANKAWSQQQLDVCQVENPFVNSETDYPQVNVERVVLAAPEVIIQPSSHSVNAPASINWQQWPEIPAVKSNAFIAPNANKLHRMTSRSLDELAVLCEKIDGYRKNSH